MAPTTFDEFKRLLEQRAEWIADLPTPVKGGNGPRFAERVDLPVTHMAGFTDADPPRRKAKAKAKPILTIVTPLTDVPSLAFTLAEARLDSTDPIARMVAWAVEREAIRQRKEAGELWPWTTDPILVAGRFCNVYREHDAVSRWVAENWRDPHRDNPDLWFALAVARSINEPDALAELGWPVPFDAARFRGMLDARQARGAKVYRTDAYKPPMPPRELKGVSITEHLVDYVLSPMWRDRERMRPQLGETLASYCGRLQEIPRIGPFLAAQIVADLKHVEPLRSASDWSTFAAPGPGSRRGLNRVRGRAVKASWSEAVWLRELLKLQAQTAPLFTEAGLPPLDAQNLQNLLCEFDKWERAREAGGKPSRKYQPTAAPSEPKPAEQPSNGNVDGIPDYILADMARGSKPDPRPKPKADPPPPPPPGDDAGPGSNGGYPRGERKTGQRTAFYIYCDARGRFYHAVERTSTKQFPQYRWDGKQWIKGLPKGFVKVPYRLPELLDAPADAWVVIAAGEKDAETAVRLGFVATTNSGGETKSHWWPELNLWFSGKRRVAIMEDRDEDGERHVVEVANALRGIVSDIRIVSFPEFPKGSGKDLTDWAEADRSHDHAALRAKIEAAPAAVGYELIRASTVQIENVQWLWIGHLARGELEILTGVPDIGKSQVHCDLVARVTSGRDWPDGAKGSPPSDVIMLTAEDNTAHTVCPRLAAAGADLDRVHILNKIRKDNRNRMFLLQEDLDVLEHILTSNPAIALVTIDPITAYMGGKLDSHRATDVRNQLGPLKELAERTNVAFSAITHPAKRPGNRALDHYIGSQAYIAAPRLGHICIPEFEEGEDGKPKPTGRALFATPKHNIYVAMPTLAYCGGAAPGGRDATPGETISISRVDWAG
jgi:hypothetical protein